MPFGVTKKGSKYCVTDPTGKEFGCHSTKQGAVNQIAAIESNKSKSGLELVAADKIRCLAADLESSHGAGEAPIVMMSDGSPEGTMLMVHGQMVPFKSLMIDCYRTEEYPSCSISITIVDKNEDGMHIEKTLRLRKETTED